MHTSVTMKILIAASFLFAVHIQGWALVESIGLAGMETVMPSGPGDCGRNPALLPFNNVHVAIGGFGSYRPLSSYDMKVKTDVAGLTVSDSSFTMSDIINASAAGGIIFGTEHAGFGLMFNAQEDQYAKTKNKMKMSGTMTMQMIPPATGTMVIDMVQSSESSSRTVNPAAELAWGYRTSDNFSFGVRLTGLYGKTITEEKKISTQVITASGFNGTETENSTINSDIKTIGGALRLGFLFRDENAEAGLIISTGDIMRRTSKIKEKISQTSTIDLLKNGTFTAEAEGEPSTSSPAPSIAIGFRWIMKWADIAGEGKIASPGYTEYKDPSFYIDTATGTIMTGSQNVSISKGIDSSARLGLVFHPAPWFQFITGGGFIMEVQKETIDNGSRNSNSTNKIYVASAALQLTPWKHITIGGGAACIYFTGKNRSSEYDMAKSSSYNSTSKATGIFANTYAGVSMQF